MITVGIPSRGLIHSRTMEDVLREVQGQTARLVFTHDLPIPDCFNRLVTKAKGSDYLWLVEEDMKLPEGILDELLSLDVEIATANYPAKGHPVVVDHGFFTQFGTGCTLIRMDVFDKLDRPYFNSDVAYTVPDWRPIPAIPHLAYGGHDIDFAMRTHKLGLTFGLTKAKCGQYVLDKLGEQNVNHGAHKVSTMVL